MAASLVVTPVVVSDGVAGTTHTMAHALNSGTATAITAGTALLRFTVVGDNRNNPTCTYNGVAGTRLDNDTGGYTAIKSASVFGWLAASLTADTDSHNFVVTWVDGSCTDAVGIVQEWQDVDQAAALTNINSTFTNGTGPSVTLTPSAAGVVIVVDYVLAENKAMTAEPGTPVYTSDANVVGTNKRRVYTFAAPDTSLQTYSWTLSAGGGQFAIAHEIPSVAAGSALAKILQQHGA